VAGDWQTILVSGESSVRTITLNRPDSLNAFNEPMKKELLEVLKQAERDGAVRCVVLTGAGRAFSSGQDLAELKGQNERGASPELGDLLHRGYHPLIRRVREMEKPVVAAVNGVAAGAGCSLALACDLRVASEKASFIEAFIHVGLIPDSGSTFLLPRLVGLAKATELCLLGEKVTAEETLRLGLVQKVVAAEQLLPAAMELAHRLAALPTRAIGLTKRLLNQSFGNDLEGQLAAEAFAQTTAGGTADHLEGVRAFLEKRPANFEGR